MALERIITNKLKTLKSLNIRQVNIVIYNKHFLLLFIVTKIIALLK